jgi:PAS domain S-box-containing protein
LLSADDCRDLLVLSPDAVLIVDADGRVCDANPAALTLFGYPRAALLRSTIGGLIPPGPAHSGPESAAFPRDAAWNGDLTVRANDGVEVPVEARAIVMAGPTGPLSVVFLRDQRDRQRLEQELRASEARYRSLVEHLPAVVYTLANDEHQTTTFVSPQFEALTGFAPIEALDQARQQPWLDFVHPDDQARVAEAAAISDATGEPFRSEHRIARRDGNYVWVRDECVAVHDEAGQLVAWQGVYLDISELKEAEHALAASEAQFRTAFENAPIGMALVHPDGPFLRANRALCAMLGLSEDELLRTTFLDITHPDDLPDDLVQTRRALAGEIDVFAIEKRYIRSDGQLIWVRIVASLLRDEYGSPRYFISQIEDITERKRLDEELRGSLAAARAGIHAKERFLAMMSHELRTPLQAIAGYADLLLTENGGTLTAVQAEDVGVIRGGASRMMTLIDQLLELSRLDAGQHGLLLGPVDLGEIVAQVRQDVAPQAAEKNVALRRDLPPSLPLVLGNAMGIRQILLNLVGNAVKFTERGEVVISVAASDGGVAITVRDTGIGIAADALVQIFEEFHQVDSAMNRRYPGAGLGLAIAQRLAEQMGGSITVTSRPGVGSAFTLHLPAAAPVKSIDVVAAGTTL